MTDIILIIAFYVTQLVYFMTNVSYDILFLKRPTYVNKVNPSSYKKIHSLVPVYDEPKSILRANFESQLNSDYPANQIEIFPIVEEKDVNTVKAVHELAQEPKLLHKLHPIIVPNNGTGDWKDVITKWSPHEKSSYDGNMDLPFGKGRALTYAYYSARSNLRDTDLLTVFDAEDIIHPDLFKYAVSGLEQGHGIIQGKIRYRNKDTNILTAIGSMEQLIWSNHFYNHTSNNSIPYQVLGPAYFFDSKLPEKVGGWSPYTTSEDVEFGLRNWEIGNKLAVLDVYTDELGVPTIKVWFKQRKRWVRGHQKVFLDRRLKGDTFFKRLKNNYYYYTYSLNSQLTAINSLIGVPIGIYALVYSVPVDNVFIGITFFNLLNWIYSIVNVYKSFNPAKLGKFKTKKDFLKYVMRVNPVTFMFWGIASAIPIVAALKDYRDSKNGKKIIWEKTPREGYEELPE